MHVRYNVLLIVLKQQNIGLQQEEAWYYFCRSRMSLLLIANKILVMS